MTNRLLLGVLAGAWAALPVCASDVTFTSKPKVVREGAAIRISFAVSTNTDVEVAVLDATNGIVRHLAAGVLGVTPSTGSGLSGAPPEPLKPGLSQTLVWDGKDDFGVSCSGVSVQGTPPPPSTRHPPPFSVRVRAGMGAKFGRFIAADPYIFGGIDDLVVGDDGNLYISGFSGPANECQKTIRVFTSEGKFLRTILPFPASLPSGAMKEVARWDEDAKTWRPRNLNVLNPEFYNNNNGYADYRLIAASKESGLVLVSRDQVYRIGLDGSVPGAGFATGQRTWPVFDRTNANNNHYGHPFHYAEGLVLFNASADGKYLFLTGPVPNKEKRGINSPAFPFAAVFRMQLDGKDEMKLFTHIPATYDGPWSKPSGALYGGRTAPVHGVCTDAKNKVYVCDREKDRVAVFSEDGKPVGEIAVKNPDIVVVHPKSGVVYVVRRFCNGWGTHSMILDKFDNFAPGAKVVASYTFNQNNAPKLAVVASGGRTLLWFSGVAPADARVPDRTVPAGLFLLEDKGAAFAAVPLPYGPKPGAQADFARIATDPLREEVYVSNGENLIYRYNGDTGEGGLLTKGGKPFFAPDLTVGYDGLLYVRSGEGYSGPLERVTRDLEPVPFPSINSNVLYPIYGRYGIGFCEKGVGVGPDGKVYDCWMYDFAKYFVSGWDEGGLPLKGKYLPEEMKKSNSVSKDVKLPEERKITGAVIGPVPSDNGGVRVDLQGTIYVGMRLLPKGYVAPAPFEKSPDYNGFVGSVVKFPPAGGAVLGIPDSASRDTNAPHTETTRSGVTIEGALAMYPGVAPFSGGGYGGNTSCCVCRVGRFDLDRYGRLALPNVVSTSIRMVDNAGNTICEFGAYGNFDSQWSADAGSPKPLVGTPAIPLCWPTGVGLTEKAAYICDTYNRRVVRADFTWQAEETVAVK